MLQAGEEVVHPQWGRGTVLFDKPHCIGIRFVEHGQVNFSQEEWQSQHSPPERFRGIASIAGSSGSELEYVLQSAVENGDLSEQEALELLARKVHPLEIKKRRTADVNEAYQRYLIYPEDPSTEDAFYQALLRYITAIVKSRHSHDRSTYSNVEDAIQDSLIEVWRCLERFDGRRSSFKTWVSLIVTRNVRDTLKKYRVDRGNSQRPSSSLDEPNHFALIEEEETPSNSLPADKKLQLDEFLKALSPMDRAIVKLTMDGLTTREVGDSLGLSAMSISRKLRHLRAVTKGPF